MSGERTRSEPESSSPVDGISRRGVLKTAAVAGGAATVVGTPQVASAACSDDRDQILHKEARSTWDDCENNYRYPDTALVADNRFGVSYVGRNENVYKFLLTGVANYYGYYGQEEYCSGDRSASNLVGREPLQDLTITADLIGKSEPATQVDAYKDYVNAGLLGASEWANTAEEHAGEDYYDMCDVEAEFDEADYEPPGFSYVAEGAALIGGAYISAQGGIFFTVAGTAVGGIPFVQELATSGSCEDPELVADNATRQKYKFDWCDGACFASFSMPVEVTVDDAESGTLQLSVGVDYTGPCNEADTNASAGVTVPTSGEDPTSSDLSISTSPDYERC